MPQIGAIVKWPHRPLNFCNIQREFYELDVVLISPLQRNLMISSVLLCMKSMHIEIYKVTLAYFCYTVIFMTSYRIS